MDKLMKNKNMVIVGVIILVLVGAGLLLTNRGGAANKKAQDESILPEMEAIPTVDSSVQVELTADAKKQEATLTVSGFPKGTETIEYSLSYDALVDGESVPKGVIGTFDAAKSGTKVSKKVTLGTCSSGTCKYDKITSKVAVELKFQGTYGAQLYQGSFDL